MSPLWSLWHSISFSLCKRKAFRNLNLEASRDSSPFLPRARQGRRRLQRAVLGQGKRQERFHQPKRERPQQPAGMSGAGRRLASQHRRLASNLGHGFVCNLLPIEVSQRVSDTRSGPISEMPTGVTTPAELSANVPVLDSLMLGTTSCISVLETVVSSKSRQSKNTTRPEQIYDMPTVATSGKLSDDVTVLDNLILGSTSGIPVSENVFSSIPRQYKNTRFSWMRSKGRKPFALQHTFNTLGGPRAGFSTSSKSGVDTGNSEDMNVIRVECGNTQELCHRITFQVGEMKAKVLGFKARYKKYIRSSLASRCLIVPVEIDSPWTVFLHRQTFRITKKNPSYLSCFDVMAYDSGRKVNDEWDGQKDNDDDWERFLEHLVEKKIYVIEDWNSSYSTVEVLMYDHGLKQPDDGTKDPFYKGECDASYDPVTKTASLSYIIWKDDKIIYSEVFSQVNCSSSVEAEIYACCALLYKAEELKISKLLVCCDNKTVVTILSGEHPINMSHPNRDFYLMLRAMKSRFKRLVVTWKPRELMLFVDDLAKAAKLHTDVFLSNYATAKWLKHLRGLPIFRLERTNPTSTAVKKFRDVVLGQSYGINDKSVYFVEVEEEFKFDCLVGLDQAFKPLEVSVFINNFEEKSDSFKQQFMTRYRHQLSESAGSYCKFINKYANSFLESKCLVISLDYSLPKEIYYTVGAFHVVLVTPTELDNMTEKIPELTALGFVYFNGVRFPLTDPNQDEEKK